MATPYSKIYERVLSKFEDYELPLMEQSEVEEYLHTLLLSAIVDFSSCYKDLSKRNDELQEFEDDLDNNEVEILSNYIVLHFENAKYIRVPLLLKSTVGTKDFHQFSDANKLDKLLAMHDTFRNENETLLSRYCWSNFDYKNSKMCTGYRKKEIR